MSRSASAALSGAMSLSHTPIAVGKLTQAQAAGPWVDALRKFVPENEKLYTWWSYRSPDWQKANKGRRLDHIWVSPALGDLTQKAMAYSRFDGRTDFPRCRRSSMSSRS